MAKPALIYIIAIKRHHSRFIPVPGTRLEDPQTKNVMPGFVTDRSASTFGCVPNEEDGFMVSHKAIPNSGSESSDASFVPPYAFTDSPFVVTSDQARLLQDYSE